MTYGRIPGCDYCPQCRTEYQWLKVTPRHPERLYCDCGWAFRLRNVDSADLEELRVNGDQVAAGELRRRMLPGRAA